MSQLDGMREKKYVQSRRKRMAPLSFLISSGLFVLVVLATISSQKAQSLWDAKGFAVVVGGTIASLIFQFDLRVAFDGIGLLARSLLGAPDKAMQKHMAKLDKAILAGRVLGDLGQSQGLNGDLLNDTLYMSEQGLTFDEIDEFITGRIKDEYFERDTAVQMLQKAAIIAPSFGLFGTVIGLVHVMQSMSNPSQIGPSMSLALMTTAYGAGLASLVFTPLSGRLEHHNQIFIEVHKQYLTKLGILMKREERSLDHVRGMDQAS
jgi:chemotaxis protein MotA